MDEAERDLSRQRDGILALKALVLFLLRRGILGTRQVAMWLVEPLEDLGFRRPLAVLAEGEDRLGEVVNASGAFTRPEPVLTSGLPAKRAVAAGAVGRGGGLARR